MVVLKLLIVLLLMTPGIHQLTEELETMNFPYVLKSLSETAAQPSTKSITYRQRWEFREWGLTSSWDNFARLLLGKEPEFNPLTGLKAAKLWAATEPGENVWVLVKLLKGGSDSCSSCAWKHRESTRPWEMDSWMLIASKVTPGARNAQYGMMLGV